MWKNILDRRNLNRKNLNTRNLAIVFAVMAAALYALNVPVSKLLLEQVAPTMMAAFLYLGAGIGLMLYAGVQMLFGRGTKLEHLTRKELPFTVGMVVLDIAAPILLMLGIQRTNSANVSLLNNFEIVATTLIAFVIFKEVISKQLWLAIGFVTIASTLLSFEGSGAFMFNEGSLFVLGASICWGLENNCTRMISNKSSEEIVVIKGCFSGLGSLLIALSLGEQLPAVKWIVAVLLLGFVSYGLSIHFYIRAQKDLGAAKTSAYYSVAPFLGVTFSMVLLKERLGIQFYIAGAIMIAATILMIRDSIALQHSHEHEHLHTHEHRHGELVHSHEHAHSHIHQHVHGLAEDAEQDAGKMQEATCVSMVHKHAVVHGNVDTHILTAEKKDKKKISHSHARQIPEHEHTH